MATVEREVTFSEPVSKSQLPNLPDGGETPSSYSTKVTFESDAESDGEYALQQFGDHGKKQRQRTHSVSSQSSTFSNEAERCVFDYFGICSELNSNSSNYF
jgi:hypothetical protein